MPHLSSFIWVLLLRERYTSPAKGHVTANVIPSSVHFVVLLSLIGSDHIISLPSQFALVIQPDDEINISRSASILDRVTRAQTSDSYLAMLAMAHFS